MNITAHINYLCNTYNTTNSNTIIVKMLYNDNTNDSTNSNTSIHNSSN